MFQFTHPVRGATIYVKRNPYKADVSIHAPRAGCDPYQAHHIPLHRGFNSRTPCGVRHATNANNQATACFNSRIPCGVRLTSVTSTTRHFNVSIHAPHAGCDVRGAKACDACLVSIHAPRAGCDRGVRTAHRDHQVSIHAPRAGCDAVIRTQVEQLRKFQFTHPVRGATSSTTRSHTGQRSFNSRTPCGVRRLHLDNAFAYIEFQFTHPVRGAT